MDFMCIYIYTHIFPYTHGFHVYIHMDFICIYIWISCAHTFPYTHARTFPYTHGFHVYIQLSCTPPHDRAKNIPKQSPGVRFHGAFGGVAFWGPGVYIHMDFMCIYIWISCVHTYIHIHFHIHMDFMCIYTWISCVYIHIHIYTYISIYTWISCVYSAFVYPPTR